jgi:hypothetical protein
MRLACPFGHQRPVAARARCSLPLPASFLADEKHSRCLTEKGYLSTIVHGRVIWRVGYTEAARSAALSQSYTEFQRAAFQHEPTYRARGILRDGSESTARACGRCFQGVRLVNCPRHAINKPPGKPTTIASQVREVLRFQGHTLPHRCASRKVCGYLRGARATSLCGLRRFHRGDG